MSARLPEAPDGLSEIESELCIALSRQAVERRADVVVLGLERVEPVLGDGRVRLQSPGKREKPLRVPLSKPLDLA